MQNSVPPGAARQRQIEPAGHSAADSTYNSLVPIPARLCPLPDDFDPLLSYEELVELLDTVLQFRNERVCLFDGKQARRLRWVLHGPPLCFSVRLLSMRLVLTTRGDARSAPSMRLAPRIGIVLVVMFIFLGWTNVAGAKKPICANPREAVIT